MTAVRGRMKYETGSTHVRTLADEALSAGHGVCQDFAHVLIGVCRLHGIPARYVSGYLYDPRASGNGNSASHAWVDVWEPERGWVSLDPTHDREQTDRYVRVGVGRDYADVPPTRGVYKGKAKEELEVAVRIRELCLANGGGDRLEQRRRHGRELVDRLGDLPARAVRLADLVRDRPDLDRRHAGEAAARRTPNPSIASTATSRPTLPTAALVPIGSVGAAGKHRAARPRAAAHRRGARSTSAIAAARSQ